MSSIKDILNTDRIIENNQFQGSKLIIKSHENTIYFSQPKEIKDKMAEIYKLVY